MTSGSAIHLSAGWSWIRQDRLRLTRRFRARLPEIDDARNPLIAHAPIGSQEDGCSKGHAL
jgi:hypothetical protein